ncbi:hypothetical protein QUF58_08465 [Anaerolineales bacterium HSG24]|nr:hypothetical protein [Anaerolineales bacterium HSG24]
MKVLSGFYVQDKKIIIPWIPWIQGEARRIGVLISKQRYTALPSPYDCQTRNLFRTHS